MKKDTLNLLNDVNRAIIRFRGIYSEWSARHKISYNEMLVLYTIREAGYFTQKQICDSYLLPKQTIHNVIAALRREGLLEYDKTHGKGREKAFVLSQKGKAYAAPFLESLDKVETKAIKQIGEDNIRACSH